MLISLNGITKVYRVGVETVRALDGIDLAVGGNEMVAIMGSSGSGKSTLMNMLGCLDRPTSGEYLLDGRNTSRMNAGELARIRNERIGFIFQSFELLFRSTALANVELPTIYAHGERRRNRRQRALAALDKVGLSDRVNHRPNQLSGGQKQRVAIARALLNDPAILLADEPTGNLDSRTTAGILEVFRKLHEEGQTVLIVTHEDEVASHCTRVVRLHDGRVSSDLPIEEDPASKLRTSVEEDVGRGGEC